MNRYLINVCIQDVLASEKINDVIIPVIISISNYASER